MPFTITRRFIDGVIAEGRLTEARRRYEAGTSKPSPWKFDTQSCWAIVCEEVLDTDHDPEGYDAVYAELIRRGFSAEEIDWMRRLAWRTAGWLNYDMMLWDWVNLDEDDMRRGLDWQLKKRIISPGDRDRDLHEIQAYLRRDPPLKPVAEKNDCETCD